MSTILTLLNGVTPEIFDADELQAYELASFLAHL
jgi:hypothetical protein